MAQAMITLMKNRAAAAAAKSRITDFFVNDDATLADPAPTSASPVLSDSNCNAAASGAKKPRKRGRRPKSAAAGKACAPAGTKTAAQSATKTPVPAVTKTPVPAVTKTPVPAVTKTAPPVGSVTAGPAGTIKAAPAGSITAAPTGTTAAPAGSITAAPVGSITVAPAGTITAAPAGTKTVATWGTKSKRSSKKQPGKGTVKEPPRPITDFFEVRRSDRRGKSSTEVKKLREMEIIEKIKAGCEEGLQVQDIEGKGRGVVATRNFLKDDFVVEYAGELVNISTARQREDLYEKDEQVGCYMYYFNHRNKQYCIDATEESGKLGRLVNHSRRGNCYTRVFPIGDRPYLVLLAANNIDKGTELSYDYGDRSQKALESHPWLKL